MTPDHYDANFSNIEFQPVTGSNLHNGIFDEGWADRRADGCSVFRGTFRGDQFFVVLDANADVSNYMVPVRPSTRDLPVGSVIVVKYDDRPAEAYLRSSLSSWAAATPDKTTTIDATGMENVICRETDWEVIFTPEPSDTFDDH